MELRTMTKSKIFQPSDQNFRRSTKSLATNSMVKIPKQALSIDSKRDISSTDRVRFVSSPNTAALRRMTTVMIFCVCFH